MRFRALLVPTGLVVCAVLVTVLGLEVLLRSSPLPWPRGAYGGARFDPDLGLNVHDRPVIYNQIRWNIRVPNAQGFLDAEHTTEKLSEVIRVGFFGDSYVEAMQVDLDDTFFRRLPAQIGGTPIEPLAFGISGWGTLHSLMAYRILGPRYDLDYVVYLFVHNDPGDHSHSVQRALEPTAELADDQVGFVIRMPEKDAQSSWRPAFQFIEAHLNVAQVVRTQLAILREGLSDNGDTEASHHFDQNDLLSAWSPATLAEAKELTRRILKQFHDEVVRNRRHFVVLYVPRGDMELAGTLSADDGWFPWLSETCKDLGIDLWDPRALLSKARNAGEIIYDDHWSLAAHRLIASFVAQHLADAFTAEASQARAKD